MRRDGRVLRRRLHLTAGRCARQEILQRQHGRDRDAKHADVLQRDDGAEDVDVGGRHDRGEGLSLGAEELLHGFLA